MNQLRPDIADPWTTLRSLRSSDMHLLHRPTEVTGHFLSLGLQTVQQPACCILLALPSSITSFKSSSSKHFFWLTSAWIMRWAVSLGFDLRDRACSGSAAALEVSLHSIRQQPEKICLYLPIFMLTVTEKKNDAFILQCVMLADRLEDWSASKTCSEECRKQHSWVVRSKKLWRGARKGKYYHSANWN